MDRGERDHNAEFTLNLPRGDVYSAKNRHLFGLIDRKRRAMARLIITRCFKSYDINLHYIGCTPLSVAAIYGEEEMLRLLCERKDVDINKQDGGGSAALHHASSRGQVGCMRILLGMGKADADTLNGSSYTALHIAAYNGHLEAAALLIERGAKVNAADVYGETPLDWAQSKVEMEAFLKSKGAKLGSQLLPAPQRST